MNIVTISKKKIDKEGAVVVLSMSEYRKLQEQAVPKYFLSGKEANDLDMLANEGLKEHRSGKTIKARSLKEALRKYGTHRKR